MPQLASHLTRQGIQTLYGRGVLPFERSAERREFRLEDPSRRAGPRRPPSPVPLRL
ncbi:hypothetical protein [Streptomyces mirabilis]|uniref:hypothetical protein n=1 Tax=Streptomyces mirabilis TaxID=68239 RepID=UPI0033D785B6